MKTAMNFKKLFSTNSGHDDPLASIKNRFLSHLLLLLIIIGTISAGINQFYFNSQPLVITYRFYIACAVLILLCFIFYLNKKGLFNLATVLTFITCYLPVLLLSLPAGGDDDYCIILVYLIIPALLGSVLRFSLRWTTLLTLFNVTIFMSWSVIFSSNFSARCAILIVFLSSISLIIFYYRDKIEKVRNNILQESEDRCRAIIENAGDGIFVISSQGKCLFANQRFACMSEYNNTELEAMPDLYGSVFLTHKDQLPAVVSHCARGESFHSDQTFFLLIKSAKTIPVEINLTHIVWNGTDAVLGIIRDVSMRLETEKIIHHKQAFIHSIVQTSPAGILFFNEQGAITYVNSAIKKALELSDENVLGRTCNDLEWKIFDFDGNPIGKEKTLFKQVQKSMRPVNNFRFSFECQSGKRLLFSANAVPLFDQQEQFRGVVATIQDITENIHAQQALLESESRYRKIFESISDGLVVITFQGVIVEANKALCAIFSDYGSDLCGKSIYDFFLPDYRSSFEEFLTALRIDGACCTEVASLSKDAQEMQLHVYGSTISFKGKNYGLVVVRDVTQQHTALRELKESETRLQSIFNTSPIGIGLVTIDRIILKVNKRMCEMSGYSEEELCNQNSRILYTSDDQFRCIGEQISRQIKQNKSVSVETQMKKKNGEVIDILVRASLTGHDTPRPYLTFTALDVTDNKHIEQERRKLQQRLHQAEKMEAIGQLAGGIAHDFNNQLTGIMSYTSLLQDELQENRHLLSYTDQVLLGSKRAAALTEQLLAFARKGKYQVVPLDIHQIVRDVAALLEHSIDKKITIVQRLTAHYTVIQGDPSQIQNAVLNLALNARDAMPEGGELVFETKLKTVYNGCDRKASDEIKPGNYLQLSVTDSGIGIDERTIQHIFEPFFTTKEPGRGTGMGLAAVYGTVKNHNGAISVRSEVAKGTSFTILLPLSTQQELKKVPQIVPANTSRGHAKILLIDDEENVCKAIGLMLRKSGYQITAYTDGADALKYYSTHWKEIDLVLLDMIMPVMGGKELYVSMRRVNPSVNVLLSSGYSIDRKARDILDQGARAFIQKPFTVDEIIKKITEILQTG